MKRYFVILTVILFLLTSCNMPLFNTNPQPQVDPNEISMRVAATLTAAIPQTISSSETPQINLPTVEQQTITPTITLTETPTITLTATTQPGDPRLNYGAPSYKWDQNSSGNPFGLKGEPYEDEAVLITHNGSLTFKSLAANYGNRWRVSSTHPMDFYLEGTFTTSSCSGYDNYGLVLQIPGYNDKPRYYFGIACNGQYIFQQWSGENPSNLISWTADANIKAGANQTNRLGILSQNNGFKFYINGVLVKEYTGAAITAEGHFGANINAKESSNFTVSLTELLEWDL